MIKFKYKKYIVKPKSLKYDTNIHNWGLSTNK